MTKDWALTRRLAWVLAGVVLVAGIGTVAQPYVPILSPSVRLGQPAERLPPDSPASASARLGG